MNLVFGEMLPRQPLRFMLAHDPGAGETGMVVLPTAALHVGKVQGVRLDMAQRDAVSGFAGRFLRDGVTSGGFGAILMTFFIEMANPRLNHLKAI